MARSFYFYGWRAGWTKAVRSHWYLSLCFHFAVPSWGADLHERLG
jgi:hypothetical protein